MSTCSKVSTQDNSRGKVGKRVKTARFLFVILIFLDIAVLAMMAVYDTGVIRSQFMRGQAAMMEPQMYGLCLWVALWALWHYIVIEIATNRI